MVSDKLFKVINIYFIDLIKFYLTEKVKTEEVFHVVEYLTCVTDPQHIIEVMDVLLSLCERASKSEMIKRLSGMGRGGGGTS